MLIVGRIGRPHGIRGEVTVEVRTDEPEARFAPGSVLGTDPGAAAGRTAGSVDVPEAYQIPGELTVLASRWHQDRLLVTFEGIPDRNVAEALRDVLLHVESAEVSAPADPDEFHDHQLIGLAVVDPAGEPLGEVTRIDHAPASDLIVLRRPEGGTALVPFVRQIVPEVDLAGRRIVVDAPPGLFDL
ncbi:ribosome maturation factor RimM [Plantactinospora sp. KBS50]|uniref:ribosome maturation factor RimM n=1 Tax=Plantactinospora sp. KBS50 TaxID=2024580 RepID=UPI0018E01DB0|nr:ribosome maturation factor RimM [Plantactinospora sp. KBS50]